MLILLVNSVTNGETDGQAVGGRKRCNRSLNRTHVAPMTQVNESPGQLNDRKYTV